MQEQAQVSTKSKLLTKFPSFESTTHTSSSDSQNTNSNYTEDRISRSRSGSGSNTYSSPLDTAAEALAKENRIKWILARGKCLRQRIPLKAKRTTVYASRSYPSTPSNIDYWSLVTKPRHTA